MITASMLEKHYEEVCKFRGKTGFFCPIGDCEAFVTDANLLDHLQEAHVQQLMLLLAATKHMNNSKACAIM
jgi:hypothetical protein